MSEDVLSAGDVIRVELPSHEPRGHEQEGTRPAIVAGAPTGTIRYPIVIIVPLTTTYGDWAEANPKFYPRLAAGVGGLPRSSTCLLDQVRALDVQRIADFQGVLPPDQFQPIRDGLRRLLGGE